MYGNIDIKRGNYMKLKYTITISVLFFMLGCSGGGEGNVSSEESAGGGIKGCSHTFRDTYDSDEEAYSNIEFSVDWKYVDSKVNLVKEEGKNSCSLAVIGYIEKKGGGEVSRSGNICYRYEQGVISNVQNWLPLRVNKNEFVEAFGNYPTVRCEIVDLMD